jgi:membrane glycosyltransferase
MNQTPISDVAHVIQLSVAPVFLLTSVGTILGVLSTRLHRIVDRSRVLRERLQTAAPEKAAATRDEMRVLARRRHLVNFAIGGGVCAALLVCILIACAFTAALFEAHVGKLLAVLFVAAMVAFVAALVAFLREVLLAAVVNRIDPDEPVAGTGPGPVL